MKKRQSSRRSSKKAPIQRMPKKTALRSKIPNPELFPEYKNLTGSYLQHAPRQRVVRPVANVGGVVHKKSIHDIRYRFAKVLQCEQAKQARREVLFATGQGGKAGQKAPRARSLPCGGK